MSIETTSEALSGDAWPELDISYAKLPPTFFEQAALNPVPNPQIIKINEPLADRLGFGSKTLKRADALQVLAGNCPAPGAKPIALAYAGQQFGNLVPQLGDGRALLIGEVIDRNGARLDIQLKGSGPTRFSRNGDGRAAIGPVLREYVVSEAMAALGIPTTRTLAAVTTGESVYREGRLPGAILTRVAASHIRIGTFQYFSVRGDVNAIRQLADYAIGRHFPEIADREQPYLSFLDAVIARQADLIARWMQVGFIHGVMNTDNMTISGETIDYGPCAFMDGYHPAKVFSSIDHRGRYAFNNQPGIGLWNLARLAETLLLLIDADTDKAVAAAEASLSAFRTLYEESFHAGVRRKLGLLTARDADIELASDLFDLMAKDEADFTLTFRSLSEDATGGATRTLFKDQSAFEAWHARWYKRVALEGGSLTDRQTTMLATNPKYIPRNHRVEEVIVAATEDANFAPFETLLDVVTKPFDAQPDRDQFAAPPQEDERVLRTFCGT